jgi:ketol-acid reductoisomerase
MTRGKKIVTPEVKKSVKQILTQIENGNFAREWRRVQKRKPDALEIAHKQLLSHRITTIEDKLEKIRKEVLKVI